MAETIRIFFDKWGRVRRTHSQNKPGFNVKMNDEVGYRNLVIDQTHDEAYTKYVQMDQPGRPLANRIAIDENFDKTTIFANGVDKATLLINPSDVVWVRSLQNGQIVEIQDYDNTVEISTTMPGQITVEVEGVKHLARTFTITAVE